MDIIISIIFWFIFSILVGAFADSKGRSGIGFFILSLLLSPLIGFLVALVSPTNIESLENQAIESGDMKKCPFCAEVIRREALVCRYCNKEVAAKPEGPKCPKCDVIIKADAKSCWGCGEDFSQQKPESAPKGRYVQFRD